MLIVVIAVAGGGYLVWKKLPQLGNSNTEAPYTTETPKKRSLSKSIDAQGKLKAENTVKIGSLVAGILRKLHIEENNPIKVGDAIADIDDGAGDTAVRQMEATVKKAEAALTYEQAHHARIKKLHDLGQVSCETMQLEDKVLSEACADLELSRARLDKENLTFKHKTIISPTDGMITHCDVSEGMRVTTDLNATVIAEIAPDIKKMNAKLEIDESDVGYAEIGQIAEIIADSHPDKKIEGKLNSISYSTRTKNGNTFYEGLVEIDNSEGILRPGMTVRATIQINSAKDALSISNLSFHIGSEAIKATAKKLGARVTELEKRDGKTVWLLRDREFVEKNIDTGFTDDTHTVVKDGLTEDDKVVVDVEEVNLMNERMKKAFSNF